MKTKEMNAFMIECLDKQQSLISFCEECIDHIFKEESIYLKGRFHNLLDGEDYCVLSLKLFLKEKQAQLDLFKQMVVKDEK